MKILCLRYMEESDTYSNFRGGSRMTCDRVRFFQKAYLQTWPNFLLESFVFGNKIH